MVRTGFNRIQQEFVAILSLKRLQVISVFMEFSQLLSIMFAWGGCLCLVGDWGVGSRGRTRR